MDHPNIDPPSSEIGYGRPDSAYVDRQTPRPVRRRTIWWSLVLGTAAVAALVAVILAPSFNKARDGESNAGKCRSNMDQIGLGLILYANDFNGSYPDNFNQLLANEKLTAAVFVCPSSNDTAATQPAELLAGGHCSYVYLGRGLTENTVKPTDLIAYDPPSNHATGYNILFGDAHVEAVDPVRVAKLVAAAEAAMKARVGSASTRPR